MSATLATLVAGATAARHGQHLLPITEPTLPLAESILRLPEVKSRTGLSRSTIYLQMSDGAFPSSISLGPRNVGWVASEIDEWISNRIMQSRLRPRPNCAPVRQGVHAIKPR